MKTMNVRCRMAKAKLAATLDEKTLAEVDSEVMSGGLTQSGSRK